MHTAPFCFKVLLCLCFMGAVLSFHKITNISERNYQIVMVLDMSAAMQFQSRIVKLKQAVQEWIIDLVPNGALLSIVQLSSCFAKALGHLTEVNTATRREFAQLITENAIGEVCIGCGLRMAMQELDGITENSVIILVCGNENQEPGEDIQDVLKEEKLNMGRVVAVALGNSAPREELKLLANLTQGLFFNVSDDGSADDLKATFQAALDLLMHSLEAKNVEVNMTESASLNWMTTEAASSETVCLTTHDLDQDSYRINSRHFVVWLVVSVVSVLVICLALFVFTLRKWYLNHGLYHVARPSSPQLLRQELITLLEDIILTMVESLAKGEAPTLLIPNHRNWSNVDCSDGRVMLKPAGEVAVLRVKYDNSHSQHKFALIMYMLSTMHRLLLTGSTITKRELYYQDISIFHNQDSMNSVIADACCLVGAPSWQLGVVATSKGLIAGPLTIITSTNEEVDCNMQGGILIPQDMANVKKLRTRAKFVLLVEKDAAFQKLLDEGILSRLGPCLLLTGKGFPDVCTRVLLWRIWQDLQLPILALVDADPHGIDIMCVYRFGSLSMSWQAQELAVPTLKWIGIHPKEIQELGIPAQFMNRNELNKLRALLTRPYIMQNASLQYQIEALLSYGKKAEIEGVNNFSASYLTDVYIPNKILCKDVI